MDETGFRLGGKTQRLHVACTALLTFCRVCAKRGGLLSDIVEVVGAVVTDHWRPYYTMENMRRALCNAHHLRELKALVETRRTHDEAAAENLRRLPLDRGRERLRHDPLSVLSTAKKQGWKLLDALTNDPETLAASLRLS